MRLYVEANGVYNVKLIVNRVRADMIKKNDMVWGRAGGRGGERQA